jgi:hypothetical protein
MGVIDVIRGAFVEARVSGDVAGARAAVKAGDHRDAAGRDRLEPLVEISKVSARPRALYR